MDSGDETLFRYMPQWFVDDAWRDGLSYCVELGTARDLLSCMTSAPARIVERITTERVVG